MFYESLLVSKHSSYQYDDAFLTVLEHEHNKLMFNYPLKENNLTMV